MQFIFNILDPEALSAMLDRFLTDEADARLRQKTNAACACPDREGFVLGLRDCLTNELGALSSPRSIDVRRVLGQLAAEFGLQEETAILNRLDILAMPGRAQNPLI